MSNSPVILCVLDYYFPGYRGGGPITTLANIRAALKETVEIWIFTRNRDLGVEEPYASVESDTWIKSSSGPVFYASESRYCYQGLKKAIYSSGRSFDVLYLNSFFGFRSSMELNFWFKREFSNVPILLAPRGEFSSGALSIKKIKKIIYIYASRVLGLYDNVFWHASTEAERIDILRIFPKYRNSVLIAEDPVDLNDDCEYIGSYNPSPAGRLRTVFISRISPMKNIATLLKIISEISVEMELDVFGPIEDRVYWDDCQRLIANLPSNVSVSYKGGLQPEFVSRTFARYDIFAFPTLGENFGHVIFESLRAGTPVIVNNTTPWNSDDSGAIRAIPLADAVTWRQQILNVAYLSPYEKKELHNITRRYAESFSRKSASFKQNLDLFHSVIERKPAR